MIFLPLFPLTLVVYPHENLNLHIFEPRYRELINESIEADTTFGIPTYLNNKIKGYGTEVKVISLTQSYEDGSMDVMTKGIRVFRLMDFQNPAPGKLYAGGSVRFLDTEGLNETLDPQLLRLVEEFYALLKLTINFLSDDYQPFSYRIAHKIGLSPSQEYKLLTMRSEDKRQQFLIQHLERTIPIVQEIERTKDRIAMNGHFKNIDPLNF